MLLRGNQQLPRVRLESFPSGQASEEPCPGKERCIVVYLAPWCPICEASQPFVQALGKYLETNPHLGLSVTIGNDSVEAISASAKKVGGNIRLDPNDEFSHAASISSFPTWLVLDRDQNVLSRFSGGAPRGVTFSNSQISEFLSSKLAL